MNRKWIVTHALFAFFISTQLCAAANAPIQRIDVVNILGTPGSSQTDVVVNFYNDGVSTPCYTAKLPFNGAATVLVGTGYNCAALVNTLSVTPKSGPIGTLPTYEAPIYPTYISTTNYLNQITVSENTPPVFDPSNGGLLAPGTIKTNVVSHLSY